MAIGLVLCLVASLFAAIMKEPVITEHDFNYAATYRLNGETKTLEGVYRVRYVSTSEGNDRYYEGFYPAEPEAGVPEYHTIAEKDGLKLQVVFIFSQDYLMGDGDRDTITEPYLAAYDTMGVEYTDMETLEVFEAELLSWEEPQPIENTFVFSGFSHLYTGSMLAMLAVGLLVIVACMIFVKRDKTIPYKLLDKLSIALNCVVCFAAIPIITFITTLLQITMSGDDLMYQIFLCIPALTAFAVAASVSLRRKGFTKTGFIVQLIGPVLFFAPVLYDLI
jgi:hypothetical protein